MARRSAAAARASTSTTATTATAATTAAPAAVVRVLGYTGGLERSRGHGDGTDHRAGHMLDSDGRRPGPMGLLPGHRWDHDSPMRRGPERIGVKVDAYA